MHVAAPGRPLCLCLASVHGGCRHSLFPFPFCSGLLLLSSTSSRATCCMETRNSSPCSRRWVLENRGGRGFRFLDCDLQSPCVWPAVLRGVICSPLGCGLQSSGFGLGGESPKPDPGLCPWKMAIHCHSFTHTPIPLKQPIQHCSLLVLFWGGSFLYQI